MRRNHIIKHTCIAWSLILGLASCGDENLQDAHSLDAKSTPMTFTVSHPGKKLTPKNTRATETDFEKNDKIGLFVAKANSPLEIGGNLVNNAALTYDGSGPLLILCIGTKVLTMPMLTTLISIN